MLNQKLLSDLIQENVFLGSENHNGWRPIKCAVCNDHSERAAFKFDGIYTGFCDFNCGAKFKYEEGTGKLSRNAKDILEAFGITREMLRELTSSIFLNVAEKELEITTENLQKVKLHTPEVSFPTRTFQIGSEGHDEFQEPLIQYLMDRKVDPLKFYFSLDPKILRRVIIPYWRDGKLIYWQARTIDNIKPRYLNCVVAKDAVIYGYDRLHSYETAPLFVTEGVFDAEMVEGISILGSTLNAAKLEILKRTKRRLIFVRDRDSQGDDLSHAALLNGWEITTVNKKVKDLNESVMRFGLPYTAYSLILNARHPDNKLQSSIDLNLWGLEDRMRKR